MGNTNQVKLVLATAILVLASFAVHTASAASKMKGGKKANNGKKKGKRSPPPRFRGAQHSKAYRDRA